MSIDEAKAELKEIGKLNRAVENLQETIARSRAKLTNTSVQLSPDKIQSSHNNDQMADSISEIISLEADLTAKIKELATKQREIINKIWQISDLDEQTVLIARYVNEKEWGSIAKDFKREVRYVYRLHKQALTNFLAVKVQDDELSLKDS